MDTDIPTVLSQLPDELAFRLRMEHTDEVILVMKKYAEDMPQHAPLFSAFIDHLEKMKQVYAELLSGVQNTCQNQVH